MRLSGILVACVCVMSMAQCATAQGTSMRELVRNFIAVDTPFPEIVLPDLNTGEPRSITEFRGKKVLLHVFASW